MRCSANYNIFKCVSVREYKNTCYFYLLFYCEPFFIHCSTQWQRVLRIKYPVIFVAVKCLTSTFKGTECISFMKGHNCDCTYSGHMQGSRLSPILYRAFLLWQVQQKKRNGSLEAFISKMGKTGIPGANAVRSQTLKLKSS